MRCPIVVDLFSGVGGFSLGAIQAGCQLVAAVDNDPINASVHARNFEHPFVQFDLSCSSKRLRAALPGLASAPDLVIAGPPCQGFSVGGRQDPSDPRNLLLQHCVRHIIALSPTAFVIENVAGLLNRPSRPVLARALRKLRKAGFAISEPICMLNAADFGLPQRRLRVFVLGAQRGHRLPSYPRAQAQVVTVKDALHDLATSGKRPGAIKARHLRPASSFAQAMLHHDPDAMITGLERVDHSPEVTRRFESTELGRQESVSRFYRLDPASVAPTLRAGTDRSNGSHTAPRPIHYIEPRCITVREAARLHGFPDWFQFHATKWHAFRQIGNSVPPPLARSVLVEMKECLQ